MLEESEAVHQSSEAEANGLRIVGIGASAGGLAALKQLFGELPADTGFAFVVVMHLMAERESSLAELLQPVTAMPITQVQEKTRLEPNRIYVIPPARNLSTADGPSRQRRSRRSVAIAPRSIISSLPLRKATRKMPWASFLPAREATEQRVWLGSKATRASP